MRFTGWGFSGQGPDMNRKAYSGLALLMEILLLYVYKIALDVIFVNYILPTYSYEPYYGLYGEIQSKRFVWGYVLLPLLWLFVRSVLKNPHFSISRMLITIQLLLVVIPFFTLFAQTERPVSHLLWILLGFAVFVLSVGSLPKFSILLPTRGIALILTVLGIVVLIYVYGGLVLAGGLHRINFNLSEVYTFRKEYVQSRLPLFGYLVPWLGYVINMAFLIYALVRRKKIWVVLVVALQVLLFGMTNFKAFLFLPFVVLAFLWFLPRLALPRLILLGIGGSLLLLWILVQLGVPLGLGITTRTFFVPAALHSLYFDYFSQHPLTYMSGSPWIAILDVQTPYQTTSVSIIAQEYWGRGFSPNVGWVASAYANFGVLGIVVFGFLLGLYSRLADSFAARIPLKGVGEALFIGQALSLISTFLTTALITAGGLVALLTLWVLGRKLR